MAQIITLFIDGACKGNPGVGGWGAYVISETDQHQLYGGEPNTTNNRMELQAAIEGIRFCPKEADLAIWTDSNYVKKGITEWIHAWKMKKWKGVKNPDLWQQLDQLCADRHIVWNWVKGHAGNIGNEMADQLANLGARDLEKKHILVPQEEWINDPLINAQSQIKKNADEEDWLLDDPFGLGLDDAESNQEDELEKTSISPNVQSHVVITEATLDLNGPRQFILDTETTGFYFQDGDRIIEVGAIEMINRKLTGRSIHIYINPEKVVGESENIHGISDAFLKDKPKFQEIAKILFDYLKNAEIIAHNASFDMNFLDMEFKRAGLPLLSEVTSVIDTLALAKSKHPGQKNSLDALVKRYDIPERDRTFHGALLDAEILADVYLAMTGGQVSFDMDAASYSSQESKKRKQLVTADLPIILPEPEELQKHQIWLKEFREKYNKPSLFEE